MKALRSEEMETHVELGEIILRSKYMNELVIVTCAF